MSSKPAYHAKVTPKIGPKIYPIFDHAIWIGRSFEPRAQRLSAQWSGWERKERAQTYRPSHHGLEHARRKLARFTFGAPLGALGRLGSPNA
jgi:hypothetical protein